MRSIVAALDRATRGTAKRVLRGYGEFTSGLRSGPDFVIIGAKRGGTTSLYNYLLEHPSIAPLFPGRERIKGVHYFDSNFARGPRWYRSHFPLAVGGRHVARAWLVPAMTGEASPYYLFHPLAAQRLASQVPDVRLVILLRDPVERAYSHFKERARHGAEPLSFEDALDAEPARLSGEAGRITREPGYRSTAHEDHSYLAQGRYLDMLPRWFELFPRNRIYIAASEDFYTDPDRIVNEVWGFLGLRPATLRSRKRHNYHPAPGLLPETRARLELAFADHNRELEQLLGRPLPWPAAAQPARPASGAGPDAPESRPERPGSSQPHGDAGWPAVAVVVATRDRPVLLERAVRTILGQSYPGRIECVVVFDQSAPSPVAVDESASRRLHVVTNARSPGLAGARNSGIAASDAPVVAFCDDDDEWDPDKLWRQVARLESAAAEFVACGVRIHHAGKVMTRLPPPSVDLGQLVRARVTAVHPSTFVMRREALDEIGLVDEKIPGSYGEDYDWLLRAARRGPIAVVEQPLVDVYWHEQSFFAERWQTIADALGYLLRKHPELKADPHGLARIEGQIAFAQAALALRPAAFRTSWNALRNNPLERRAYLALAVASGVVPATSVIRMANRRGRGI
jgi:Glycosyl transferase family 2/Sulfotransferase domain